MVFVAIHAGAGYHSPQHEKKYKELIHRVCSMTVDSLNGGLDAVHAVELAIRLLENDPLTNAGIAGSNFTIDGHIETDASIMTLDGYGSVAACPMGLEEIHPNPISIATKLYLLNQEGVDLAGRQPPLFIVGLACQEFAREIGMEMITSQNANEKITVDQKNRYNHHLGILQESYPASAFQDTVGAIVVDGQYQIATGVSSGGISLKRRGRAGEAAFPGSGLFISQSRNASMACSLSGTGEQIMKTQLASTLLRACDDSDIIGPQLPTLLCDHFLNARTLQHETQKSVGALIVKLDEKEIECCFIHTTPSFCIGYSSCSERVVFKMSRKEQYQEFSTSSYFISNI
jgi:taspase, threonine aspartase, 1